MGRIGDFIRDYLEAHPEPDGTRMKPAKFAALSGVKRQIVENLLSGKTEAPRREALELLATFLRKSIDELLGHAVPRPSPLPTATIGRSEITLAAVLSYLGREIAKQAPARRKTISQLLAAYAENPKTNAGAAEAILLIMEEGISRRLVPPVRKSHESKRRAVRSR